MIPYWLHSQQNKRVQQNDYTEKRKTNPTLTATFVTLDIVQCVGNTFFLRNG